MSLSGTELVFEDDSDFEGDEKVISALSPSRDVHERCNTNHMEHETQSSLSMTLTPLSAANANGNKLSVDHMHIVTPSASSMQSAPTEHSVGQSQLYLSSLKVTKVDTERAEHHHSLTIDTLPLFEDDNDREHVNSNSISISSKGDSLNTSIVYHDSGNEEEPQQRIFHSHLPNESNASADSTFDGMDTSKFKITAAKQDEKKKSKKNQKYREISTDDDEEADEHEEPEDEEGNLVMLDEEEYVLTRASSINSTGTASTVNHLKQRHRPPEHILRRIALNQTDHDTETDADCHDVDTDHGDQHNDDGEDIESKNKGRRNSLHVPCYTNEFDENDSQTGLTDTVLDDESETDDNNNTNGQSDDGDARHLADFMQPRSEEDDTADDSNDELPDQVTLQMERKWLNRFNQQKRESEAKILSLQEQLTNLARQLHETQRMQHHFQLINQTPLHSNRTQRISVSNSVLSRLTDDDEYNDSEDDIDPNAVMRIKHNNKKRDSVRMTDRDTNKDTEGEDGHKSVAAVSESPLVRIFDIPSFHALFSRYSTSNSDATNDDRESESPLETQVAGRDSEPATARELVARHSESLNASQSKRKKNKIPLAPIQTDIVAQAVVRSRVFQHVSPRKRSRDRVLRKKRSSKSKSKSKQVMLQKYKNTPGIRKLSSPKRSVSQRCDDVVENEYVQRKREKQKQSLVWGWFATYTCHDFASCFRQSEHVLPGINGNFESETANISFSYREKLPTNITPL